MPTKTKTKPGGALEERLYVRMPKSLYDRVLACAGASETGESTSDIARAGILREVKLREKRQVE